MPTYSDVCERLYENGYDPLPITERKIPPIEGWSSMPIDKSVIGNWKLNGKGGMGAGIRLGTEVDEGKYLAFLDVDCRDIDTSRNLLARIRSLLGADVPVRVGNKPKFGCLILTDGISRKQKSAQYEDEQGRKHHLEILASGQQFGAYGRIVADDPTLGTVEYKWSGREPLDIQNDELPVLSQEDWEALQRAFEKEAETKKWQRKGSAAKANDEVKTSEAAELGLSSEDYLALTHAARPTASIGQLEDALKRVSPDCGNDTWYRCIAAIHFETGGSSLGLDLAIRWSSGALHDSTPPNFVSDKDVATRFESFRDSPTREKCTVATILHYAKQDNPGYVLVEDGDEDEDVEPAATTKPPKRDSGIDLEAIHDDLPPIIHELMRLYQGHALYEYSPAAALMASVMLILLLTRRAYGVKYHISNLITRSNLYLLQMMPTGIGKSAGPRMIKSCATELGLSPACLLSEVGSSQGLSDYLMQYPNIIWAQDEFADKLLAGSANDAYTFRSMVKITYQISSELYSKRALAMGRASPTQHQQALETDFIRYGHLSILGSTTKAMMARAVASSDVTSGFLNRFVALDVHNDDIIDVDESSVLLETPDSLKTWFTDMENIIAAVDRQRKKCEEAPVGPENPILIDLPLKMERRLRKLRKTNRDDAQYSQIEQSLRVRQGENAVKIAMALQLADDPMSDELEERYLDIGMHIVEAGVKVLLDTVTEEAVKTRYEDSDGSKMEETILKKLKDPAQLVTDRQVRDKCGLYAECYMLPMWVLKRNMAADAKSGRDVEHIISNLMEAGIVGVTDYDALKEKFNIPARKGRKPKQLFYLKENMAKIRKAVPKMFGTEAE